MRSSRAVRISHALHVHVPLRRAGEALPDSTRVYDCVQWAMWSIFIVVVFVTSIAVSDLKGWNILINLPLFHLNLGDGVAFSEVYPG